MFSIEKKQENGFDIVELKDGSTATSVEILPNCGGILHAFKIRYKEGFLNIIDNYATKAEFENSVEALGENSVEALGFKSCKLSPFVCRMRDAAYVFEGNNYKVSKFIHGKHALHGLIYDAPFEIIATHAGEESARVELAYTYNALDDGYPFNYECRVVYELKKGNELVIITNIINHTTTAIPIADGWHPYFTFGGKIDELQMQFNCNEMLEFDEELLPSGKKLPSTYFVELSSIGSTFLDNSFLIDNSTAKPAAVLRDPEKKMQLEISCNELYPILQVYTPNHRNSIAIENLSAAPDAFNNQIGLIQLPASGNIEFSTTYKIVSL